MYIITDGRQYLQNKKLYLCSFGALETAWMTKNKRTAKLMRDQISKTKNCKIEAII